MMMRAIVVNGSRTMLEYQADALYDSEIWGLVSVITL